MNKGTIIPSLSHIICFSADFFQQPRYLEINLWSYARLSSGTVLVSHCFISFHRIRILRQLICSLFPVLFAGKYNIGIQTVLIRQVSNTKFESVTGNFRPGRLEHCAVQKIYKWWYHSRWAVTGFANYLQWRRSELFQKFLDPWKMAMTEHEFGGSLTDKACRGWHWGV